MPYPTDERLLALYEVLAGSLRWERVHDALRDSGEEPTEQEAKDVAHRVRELLRGYAEERRHG